MASSSEVGPRQHRILYGLAWLLATNQDAESAQWRGGRRDGRKRNSTNRKQNDLPCSTPWPPATRRLANSARPSNRRSKALELAIQQKDEKVANGVRVQSPPLRIRIAISRAIGGRVLDQLDSHRRPNVGSMKAMQKVDPAIPTVPTNPAVAVTEPDQPATARPARGRGVGCNVVRALGAAEGHISLRSGDRFGCHRRVFEQLYGSFCLRRLQLDRRQTKHPPTLARLVVAASG